MSNASQQIVNKAWNFAHVLRDDGLSYMAYTEQITFLLFLKMADEQTKPPYNRPPIVPVKLGWQSLLAKDGDDLEVHYRLKDKSLEDSENLPEPDVLAQEIADDLQAALDQFSSIATELKR